MNDKVLCRAQTFPEGIMIEKYMQDRKIDMCSASLTTCTLWPDKQKCNRLKFFSGKKKKQTGKGKTQTQILDRLYPHANVSIKKKCMQVRKQTQLKIYFVLCLGDSNTEKIFRYGIFLVS